MAMGHGQIALLLLHLTLLLSTAQPSLAQLNNGTSSSHRSRTAGGFTPTTAIVLVVLIAALVLLTIFSLYINRCARAHPLPRRPSRSAAAPDQYVDGAAVHADQCRPRGLNRELVESFPTAVYGDVKARMEASTTKSGPPLECAVCLAEFADADELRVLPACCHVFHPGCIDPWLAGAATCPLCRADLTTDPAAAADLTPSAMAVQEEEEPQEAGDEESSFSVVSFTAESLSSFSTVWRHEFTGPGEHNHYRRTQSAMDAPDRHTLRLPEHVMKELTSVRRHRRAASLAAEYPDQRTPGWLTSFLRSMSSQRQRRADSDGAGEELGGGNGNKRVYPVMNGAPGEKPSVSGSGVGGDEKRDGFDVDALNRV